MSLSESTTTTFYQQTVTKAETAVDGHGRDTTLDDEGYPQQKFAMLRDRLGDASNTNAGRSRSSSMTKRHVMTGIPSSNLQNQREPSDIENVPVGQGLNNDGTLNEFVGDYASPTPGGMQQRAAPAARSRAVSYSAVADPMPRDAPADREQLAGANQWGSDANRGIPAYQQREVTQNNTTDAIDNKQQKAPRSGTLCCGGTDPAIKEEKERAKAEEAAERERKRAQEAADRIRKIEEAERQRAIEAAAKEKKRAEKNLERAEREARKKASAAVDAETEKQHARELLHQAEEKARKAEGELPTA